MAHEVTLIIFDPHGRSEEWWEDYLYAFIGNADSDITEIEVEEL